MDTKPHVLNCRAQIFLVANQDILAKPSFNIQTKVTYTFSTCAGLKNVATYRTSQQLPTSTSCSPVAFTPSAAINRSVHQAASLPSSKSCEAALGMRYCFKVCWRTSSAVLVSIDMTAFPPTQKTSKKIASSVLCNS